MYWQNVKEQIEFVDCLKAKSSGAHHVGYLGLGSIHYILAGLGWPRQGGKVYGLLTPAARVQLLAIDPDLMKYPVSWEMSTKLPGMGTTTAHLYVWHESDGGTDAVKTVIFNDCDALTVSQ